ncbi:hypothetical protein AB0B66_38330 [Catellatospora sp. NPDC049111]|uniref:hypothetical protein n=1 Tax=Catellatospora sp. NPDC049111 TaxID=3155271 RepID=UPI0033E24C56
MSVDGRRWHGLGTGYGRLRYVDLDVSSRGRGAAGRPRQATVRLPLGAGPRCPSPHRAATPSLRAV